LTGWTGRHAVVTLAEFTPALVGDDQLGDTLDARALGRDDLICSYFTLAGGMGEPAHGFAERVAVVADAGYAAIGMTTHDYQRAIASGLSDADLRAIVDDNGICVAEVEFLSGWWFADERADTARESEAQMLHMADLFDARHLNLMAGAASEDEADLEEAAGILAGVCDRAADHGLRVAIEFMDFAAVKDLGTAATMIARADRPNAGVDLDAYHFFRSASTLDDLRALGAERINCIQLADAAGPGEWTFEETTQRRLLPGEGDFALIDLIRTLADMGVDTPPSVEVLSLELWSRALAEQAAASYQATRTLLEEARA
jgi:sugar phosphate isomerase/epimerase